MTRNTNLIPKQSRAVTACCMSKTEAPGAALGVVNVQIVMSISTAISQLPTNIFLRQTLAGPLVTDALGSSTDVTSTAVTAGEVPVARDTCVTAATTNILIAVALSAGLITVHIAIIDTIWIAVAALTANERVVAVSLSLTAVTLLTLHTRGTNTLTSDLMAQAILAAASLAVGETKVS